MTAIDLSLARSADLTFKGGRQAFERIGRWLWISPIVIGLAITLVYPTLFLIALALSKSTLGKPFRDFVGLKHILAVLQDPLFLTSMAKASPMPLSRPAFS